MMTMGFAEPSMSEAGIVQVKRDGLPVMKCVAPLSMTACICVVSRSDVEFVLMVLGFRCWCLVLVVNN